MHALDMIFFWARMNPEQLAILQSDIALTYRDLVDAIEAVCERIDRINLAKREPVAVSIAHPAWQLVVCLALLRCGVTVAPIGQGGVFHIRQNGIDNLIYVGQGQVFSGGRNIRFEESWVRFENHSSLIRSPLAPSSSANPDMIFFTSGSTGVPKKVILPGASAMADRMRSLQIAGQTDFERVFIMPDLTSSFGFMRALVLLCSGKTICFSPSYEAQLLLIKTFKVQAIVASPQQILALLECIEKNGACDLNSLKEIRVAGGFPSPALVRRVQSRLCRNVVVDYGATEAGIVATANYDVIAGVTNAVGFVMPDTIIETVDEDGTPMPVGDEGIVRCRSSYYEKVFAANNPDEASEKGNVWWYPGDHGRVDENGILCINGRFDDVINSGGVKIFAGALDDFVRQHAGIADAGVCAVRGDSMEEAWIGIVPRGHVDIGALKEAIDESQKFDVVIGKILVVDEIPRTSLGKIQRFRLKEMLMGMNSRS